MDTISETPSCSSYCPDFSDMCDDSSAFWDVTPKEEKEAKQQEVAGAQYDEVFWDFLSTPVSPCHSVDFCDSISLTNLRSTKNVCHSESHNIATYSVIKEKLDACQLENAGSSVNREIEYNSQKTEDNFWDFLKADRSGSLCESKHKRENLEDESDKHKRELDDSDDNFWDFLKTNDAMRSPVKTNSSPALEISELLALKRSLNAEHEKLQTKRLEKYKTDNILNHFDNYSSRINSLPLSEEDTVESELRGNNQNCSFDVAPKTENSTTIFATVKAVVSDEVNGTSNKTDGITPSRFSPCIHSVFSIRECPSVSESLSETCFQGQNNYFKHFWGKDPENVCQKMEENDISRSKEISLQPNTTASFNNPFHVNISNQSTGLMNDSEHRKFPKRSRNHQSSPLGSSQFVVTDHASHMRNIDASELSQVFENAKSQNDDNSDSHYNKESDEIILDHSCIQKAYQFYHSSNSNDIGIDHNAFNKNSIDNSDLKRNVIEPNNFYILPNSEFRCDESLMSNSVDVSCNSTDTIKVLNARSNEILRNITSTVLPGTKKNSNSLNVLVDQSFNVNKVNPAQEHGKVSHTTPLYLVMPKPTNVSSSQNKTQLFMIIKNSEACFENSSNPENISTKNALISSNSPALHNKNASYQYQSKEQNSNPDISSNHATVHPLISEAASAHETRRFIRNSDVLSFSENPSETPSFPHFQTNSLISKETNYTGEVKFPTTIYNTLNVSLNETTSLKPRPNEPSTAYMQPNESNFLKPVIFPETHFQNVKSNASLNKQPALKNISLGKDKNAIQQTSIPLMLENIHAAKDLIDTTSSAAFSTNLTTLSPLILTYVPATDCSVKNLDSTIISTNQNNFKAHPGSIKYVTTGLKEMATTNLAKGVQMQQIKISQNHVDMLKNKPTATVTRNLNTSSSKLNEIPLQMVRTNVPFDAKYYDFHTQNLISHNPDNSKRFLTFDSLAPSIAPLSVVPVSVAPSSQSAIKPVISKITLLPNSNQLIAKQNLTELYNPRQKMSSLKKCFLKSKKLARKTVRELLQEQRRNSEKITINNVRLEQKIVKPVFKTPLDNALVSVVTSVPNLREKFVTQTNYIHSSHKRPNILILPSMAKQGKEVAPEISKISKIDTVSLAKEKSTASGFDLSDGVFATPLPIAQPPLEDRQFCVKGHRPRHYDMCELIIGCFKVQDDVDSHGRFRSKFKVLFSKRQFLYDFPTSRCNQVELKNSPVLENMVRIIVPFKTVLAMNLNNRRINLQVNACPFLYMGRMQARSGVVSNATVYNLYDSNDSLWGKSVGSSLLHRITLRKRQADRLKTYLCLFDQRFLMLTNGNTCMNQSIRIFDASPFEEGVTFKNLTKLKSKKLLTRRLPQWDYTMPEDPLDLNEKESTTLQSNQVCSCRISCRSVRCSCVKAAKSCRTGGSVCLCTNCDNPLNVLESLGMNLEFSLSDSCLFQNIYQIPKLLTFLQRDMKLSCCNTIARIQDCIPGTVLCPNVECNVQLEFSWCRSIICYPERNPRNHCSFCGQCCFSNGRHCAVCNRCYVVTSKCPNCPGCLNKEPSSSLQNREGVQKRCQVTPLLHSNFQQFVRPKGSKPEIVILDGPVNAKSEGNLQKPDEELSELIAVMEGKMAQAVNSIRSVQSNSENSKAKA